MNKPGFFNRLSQSLSKTRAHLSAGLARLRGEAKTLDAAFISSVEEMLLSADFGMPVTQTLIQDLTTQWRRSPHTEHQQVWELLGTQLRHFLKPCEVPLVLPDAMERPFLILVVGVNGVGKTTTIGKLAYYFKQQQRKVLLAAGDTFRAAATEQLRVWSERTQTLLVAQHQGADSASVLYDALQDAKTRGYEIVIADTAGRLHTEAHLMQELQKVVRVLKKLDTTAPQEVMLVIDASLGQNSLKQVAQFQEAIPVSGLAITKLDGTAKGGIVFSLAQNLKLPIRFVGVGEGLGDLQVFSAEGFV